MSKGAIRGGGVVLRLMVLEVWQRTVSVFQRFAVGVVGQSDTLRKANSSAVARPTSDFKTVEVELRGGIAEFEQFTKAMRIGDRVRAFCTDGVIEAQKVSATRFKVIYEVQTTGPIH